MSQASCLQCLRDVKAEYIPLFKRQSISGSFCDIATTNACSYVLVLAAINHVSNLVYTYIYIYSWHYLLVAVESYIANEYQYVAKLLVNIL